MSRMRAISLPLKVMVLAKSLRKVRTPRATKISRSCSVGSPSSLFPCTCQVTRAVVPSGSVLVPLISILPTFLPTRRSSTANGIAARFSSSTERFIRDCLGTALPLLKDEVTMIHSVLYNAAAGRRHSFIVEPMKGPVFYDQTHNYHASSRHDQGSCKFQWFQDHTIWRGPVHSDKTMNLNS